MFPTATPFEICNVFAAIKSKITTTPSCFSSSRAIFFLFKCTLQVHILLFKLTCSACERVINLYVYMYTCTLHTHCNDQYWNKDKDKRGLVKGFLVPADFLLIIIHQHFNYLLRKLNKTIQNSRTYVFTFTVPFFWGKLEKFQKILTANIKFVVNSMYLMHRIPTSMSSFILRVALFHTSGI